MLQFNSPKRSLRKRALSLAISKSSMHKILRCLSVSCLQIADCHNFTNFCAVSSKILKSSREEGILSSGHCSRCSIVCVSVPQLHEGSPVWFPHLIKFAFVRPTPDLSRLSVFHVSQDALLPKERWLNFHIDRGWVEF